MNNRLKYIAVFLLIAALAISGTGCSRLFGPSDAEILKAIDDSGLLKGSGFTVTQPVEILEKGKKEGDVWPVKVKLHISVQTINGQTKELVTTPTFKLMKMKDSEGKTVWKASL